MNTDKYTGHTEGPWDTLVCSTTGKKWVIGGPEYSAWEIIALIEGVGENDVGWKNMALIADSPLLLADNKRMREENSILKNALRSLVNVYELVLPDKHAEVWYEVNRILEGDEE